MDDPIKAMVLIKGNGLQQIGRPPSWILRYRWTWIYYEVCIWSLEKFREWLGAVGQIVEDIKWKNEEYLSTMIDKWDIY